MSSWSLFDSLISFDSDLLAFTLSLRLYRASPHRRQATSIDDAFSPYSSTRSTTHHTSLYHQQRPSFVPPTLSNILQPDPSFSPILTPPTTRPRIAVDRNLSFEHHRSPSIPTASNFPPKTIFISNQVSRKVQNFGSPFTQGPRETSLIVSIRGGGASTADRSKQQEEEEEDFGTKLRHVDGEIVIEVVGRNIERRKANEQYRPPPSLPSISIQPPTPLPRPLSYRPSGIELLNAKSPSPPPLPPFRSTSPSLHPLSPIVLLNRRPESQAQGSSGTLGRGQSIKKHPRSISTAEGDQGAEKKGRGGSEEGEARRVAEAGWFQVRQFSLSSLRGATGR